MHTNAGHAGAQRKQTFFLLAPEFDFFHLRRSRGVARTSVTRANNAFGILTMSASSDDFQEIVADQSASGQRPRCR
jgi:hypothetical protein